jgi:hypothetical protein
MKLLAFFLLQGLHQTKDTRAVFPGGKFWKHPYFWTCYVRGSFIYSSFFIFMAAMIMMMPLVVPKDSINFNPRWMTLMPNLECIHQSA